MSTSKATQEELNELHGLVAKAFKKNLDDPKILALAINFLKNNSVVVDELPTEEKQSLFSSIAALTKKPTTNESIEDLLKDYA